MPTTSSQSGPGPVDIADGGPCDAQCDPWRPDDCPLGEKCTAAVCLGGSTAGDSNICVPILGDKAIGEECNFLGDGLDGLDDCEAEAMCWDQNPETGLGYCVGFCTGTPTAPSCPTPDSVCQLFGDGVLSICYPTCDPLTPDCPNPNSLCIPDTGDRGFWCTLDASGGFGTYGTPCNFINSCNHGLICIDATAVPAPECAAATGRCSEICDLTNPVCAGAPEGQVCVPWWEGVPPSGYENVGVCSLQP